MTVDLVALDGKQALLRAGISLDYLDLGAIHRVEHAGVDRGRRAMRGRTGCDLVSFELFDRFQPGLGVEDEQPDFLLRRAEPVKLTGIELNVAIGDVVETGEAVVAGEAADHTAVLRRDIVKEIGGPDAF